MENAGDRGAIYVILENPLSLSLLTLRCFFSLPVRCGIPAGCDDVRRTVSRPVTRGMGRDRRDWQSRRQTGRKGRRENWPGG